MATLVAAALTPRHSGAIAQRYAFPEKFRRQFVSGKTNVDLRPTLVFPKKFATPLPEVFGPGKTNVDFSLKGIPPSTVSVGILTCVFVG